MNTDEAAKIARLLEELREGQKQQLEHQREALDLQRKQYAVFQEQAARGERIQQKAELLQDRGAALVRGTRKVVLIIVPIVVALIAYVSWLLFRTRY
jgi:hypothetical protein